MSLGRSPEAARRRRASRRHSRIPRVRSILLVLLGFVLSGVAGALSFFWPTITTALGATGHSIQVTAPTVLPGSPTATPAAANGSSAPFTVLLLGSDNDGKFTTAGSTSGFCCTQSMILVRVDPAAGSVTKIGRASCRERV